MAVLVCVQGLRSIGNHPHPIRKPIPFFDLVSVLHLNQFFKGMLFSDLFTFPLHPVLFSNNHNGSHGGNRHLR